MNNNKGNLKYVAAFMALMIVAIGVRYLIFKLRPGTFSVITFHIVSVSELILLASCALLIITEKLKYFGINLAICVGLFLYEVIRLLKNPEIHDYRYAFLVMPVIAVILLMVYPVKKLREKGL